jgi:hypothetical protein
MVKYRVGEESNLDELDPGRYYIHEKTSMRGPRKGQTEYKVYQVRKKMIQGEMKKYWHRVKEDLLVRGLPPQVSARALGLVPEKKHIDLYEKGNNVYIHTAHDQNGEHPTSHFILRRRNNGDEVVYHWSAIKPEVKKSPKASSSPAKKPKKPVRKNKKK